MPSVRPGPSVWWTSYLFLKDSLNWKTNIRSFGYRLFFLYCSALDHSAIVPTFQRRLNSFWVIKCQSSVNEVSSNLVDFLKVFPGRAGGETGIFCFRLFSLQSSALDLSATAPPTFVELRRREPDVEVGAEVAERREFDQQLVVDVVAAVVDQPELFYDRVDLCKSKIIKFFCSPFGFYFNSQTVHLNPHLPQRLHC